MNIGIHIAMLHTLFNGLNTLILLPSSTSTAALLERIIKEKPEEKELRAMYLPRGLMATPELSLLPRPAGKSPIWPRSPEPCSTG